MRLKFGWYFQVLLKPNLHTCAKIWCLLKEVDHVLLHEELKISKLSGIFLSYRFLAIDQKCCISCVNFLQFLKLQVTYRNLERKQHVTAKKLLKHNPWILDLRF